MSSQSRRRITWALAISVLLHLLSLAAYLRMVDWYRKQELRPTYYLPDLLLLAPRLFLQQPIGRIPEHLMERQDAPPDPGEAVAMPAIDLQGQTLTAVEPLPADATLPMIGQRAPLFLPQADLADFSLNEVDMEAVAQLRDQYDAYARYWSPDADPDDPESESQRQAEAIVARAFEAMGGLDELLKITQMQMVVWVEAYRSQYGEGRTARTDTMQPLSLSHRHLEDGWALRV